VSLLNDMLRNIDSRQQQHSSGDGNHVLDRPKIKRRQPVVWLIVVIFGAGLGVAFVLDRYPVSDQTGLSKSRTPEQPEEPDTALDSIARPMTSRVEPKSVDSNHSITELSPSQHQVTLPEYATQPPVEPVLQYVSEPEAEISSAPATSGSPYPGESIVSTSSPTGVGANERVLTILRQPSGFYAVQLLAGQDQSKMLDYARDIGLQDPLYTQIQSKGQLSNVLLLGVYPDARSAFQARKEFASTRDLSVKPWIRELGPLKDAIVRAYKLRDTDINSDPGQKEPDIEPAQQEQASSIDSAEQLVAKPTIQERAPVVAGTRPMLADLDSNEINVRRKSTTSKPEQVFLKEVEKLLQDNAETEALYRLEQYLVTHADSVATIEVLFKLYLRLDDADMAQKLLDRSSQLSSLTVIELGAQLEVQQGNLMDAVKMLETVAPGHEETSYYALLAGIYLKLGRFREAASNYRHLLNDDQDQGAYWLGLAVSLESLGQYEDALPAFQQTRDSGQYEGEVLHYVEQRIDVLSQ
jgi:tetratricopeptide (TPR) repeat protein